MAMTITWTTIDDTTGAAMTGDCPTGVGDLPRVVFNYNIYDYIYKFNGSAVASYKSWTIIASISAGAGATSNGLLQQSGKYEFVSIVKTETESCTPSWTEGQMYDPDSSPKTKANRWSCEYWGSSSDPRVRGTVSFVVHFKHRSYTVTFDANGGSVSTESKSVVWDLSYGTLPTPTRSGYTFAGWWTAASGGTRVTASTVVTATANHTLYAHWTANKYEYRFNNNFSFYGWAGSSSAALNKSSGGATLSVDKDAGAITISAGTEQHVHTKYSKSASEYSSYYKIGISEANASAGTQWTFSCKLSGSSTNCEVYYVEYDANHEIILNGTSQYHGLGGVSASTATYVKTFVVSSNCRAIQFFFDNHAANTTATWSDVWMQTTTNYNRGIPNPIRKILTYSDSQTIGSLPTGVSRPGYTFSWLCSVNSVATVVTSSTTMASLGSGNKSIYTGNWVANTYTVTLDAQGGSGGTSSVTATYGQAMPSITIPTRAHYAFGGYWTGAGGTGTKYYNANGSSARSWNLTAATTLYAMWTWIERIAVLDTRGGVLPDGTNYFIRVEQGSAYGTLPDATRTGYTFAGWWTAASGGTRVTASTVVTATADHTLYAHWTANAVTTTLTFDAAGGTVSPSSKQVTSGSAYGTLPTPTRTGYTFAGWFTHATGGDAVTAATVAGDEDATIYAHWTGESLTITFNANGGSVTETTRTVVRGSQYKRLPIPMRSGYNFDGWFTAATGGTQVTAADYPTSSRTLYAHWSNGTIAWWSVETW